MYKRQNFERLHHSVSTAYQLLYGGASGMPAVCDQLAKAITELANVERFDGELAQWKTVLQDALYLSLIHI